MRNIEKFAEEVKVAMEQMYPEKTVEIKKVEKNNGVILTGLTIHGENESVFPTIYLEQFYDEFDGKVTDLLVNRVRLTYESHKVDEGMKLRCLADYEYVKPRLRCRLVNFEANKDRLENIPYRPFMDLAIIPYVIVSEVVGKATFTVTKSNLDMWDVSGEQVLEDALDNTMAEEQPSITGMYDILAQMNPGLAESCGPELKESPMYVMKTEGINGAIAMIFEDRLRDFCNRMGKDVFVIPSSIYEVILVPAAGNMAEKQIDQMIRDVNEAELDEVDILSNHVYRFNRHTGYMMATAQSPYGLHDGNSLGGRSLWKQ